MSHSESLPLRIYLVFFVLLLVISGSPSLAQAETLSEDRFRELFESLERTGNEPWRSIPWKIRVLDAQREASGQQKPIFIWAMDGHPLGCT